MSNAPFRAVVLGLAAVSLGLGCSSSDSITSGRDAPAADDLGSCWNTNVEGIDVSEHNGAIDWHAVAGDHVSFAFIKATQSGGSGGLSYDDPNFRINWAGAKAAGIIRSPYHFFDPTIDGVTQAEHFLDRVGTLTDADLPPMLDLECPNQQADCRFQGDDLLSYSPSLIQKRALDFLETVEKRTGKRPMIYAYRYWFSDAGGVDASAFAKYPFFYAAYVPVGSCVTMPDGLPSYAFLQYDDATNGFGRAVAGVARVDNDIFKGSLADLKALAKKHSTSSSDPPPPPSGSCGQGDGLYCGGNGVSGSTLALYRCSGGAVSKVSDCALGCERMPDGQNDRCMAGSSCPLGNGDYCGGNHVGGSPKELYHCEDGELSKIKVCSPTCQRMSDGEDDVCATSGGSSGGTSSALGAQIVTIARSYLGYYERDDSYCNKFSDAFGRPCEQWCADYGDWVWKKAGADIGLLDASAISFYRYGSSHHTWKDGRDAADVAPGDAVIWANGYDWAEHVGLVTEVLSGRRLKVINGDLFRSGDALSSVAEVTISRDDDLDTGAPILGYASPVK